MSTHDHKPVPPIAPFVVVDTETLRTVVREALGETFGLSMETPEQREGLRKDLLHLRQWRETMEKVRSESLSAAIKWLVPALIAALVVGLGFKFRLGS